MGRIEHGDVQLRDLRPHEKLVIWRRRQGLTQGQAAARFDLSEFCYGEFERGRGGALSYAWKGPFELAGHERCYIYRTRSKATQGAVAADLGVSRTWVNRMEVGRVDCDRLIEYWEV